MATVAGSVSLDLTALSSIVRFMRPGLCVSIFKLPHLRRLDYTLAGKNYVESKLDFSHTVHALKELGSPDQLSPIWHYLLSPSISALAEGGQVSTAAHRIP